MKGVDQWLIYLKDLEALDSNVQNISSLGASFVYDVGKLLESFGYTLQGW